MRRELQIKICGNKFLENMKQVAALKIDWMGYIFYSASKRNVNKNIGPSLNALSNEIKRVGVFVNESISEIEVISKDFQLDIIQLHGDETLEYCHELKKQINLKIIKVFRIDETFDFDSVKCFEEIASYFLFDTKTNLYGGSGKKFNWESLKKYNGEIPFILSGGIGKDDFEEIKKVKHPKLIGLDLNSGFEDSPGLKNVEILRKFLDKIKN